VLPIARRRAIVDGLLRGDRKWLVLGSLAWGLRALQWARNNDEQLVYRHELQPGETLVLSREASHPPRRKRRR